MKPRDISSSQLWLEDLDESVSSLESFSEDTYSSSSSSSSSFSEDVVFPDNSDNSDNADNADNADKPLVGQRPTKKKPLPRRRATFHHGDYNQHQEQSLACLLQMVGGRPPAVSGQRPTVKNHSTTTTTNKSNSNSNSKSFAHSFDEEVDDELLVSSPMRKFRVRQAASNDSDLSKSRSCHHLTQRQRRHSETAAKLTSTDGRRSQLQLLLERRRSPQRHSQTTVATTITAASTTAPASALSSAAASTSLSTTAGSGETATDNNGSKKNADCVLFVEEVELLRSCTMVELLVPQVSHHTHQSNCDSGVTSKDTRWSSTSTSHHTNMHNASRLSSSLTSTTAHHPSPSSSNVRCPRRQKSSELLLDDDPLSFRQSDIDRLAVVSCSSNAITNSDTITTGCAKTMRTTSFSSGTNRDSATKSATMGTNSANNNKAMAIQRPKIPHRQKSLHRLSPHWTIQGALRQKAAAAAAAAMEDKSRSRPALPSFGRSTSDSLVNLMYKPNHSKNDKPNKDKEHHKNKSIGTAMMVPGRSQCGPSPASSNNDHCIGGFPFSSLGAIAKELDDDSLVEPPAGGETCCAITACNTVGCTIHSSLQQHPMKSNFEEQNWRRSSESDMTLKKPTRRASLAA